MAVSAAKSSSSIRIVMFQYRSVFILYHNDNIPQYNFILR